MERILYADDDKVVREISKGIFAEAGYEVIVAKEGIEALSLAKTVKPDLIILDYLMPGLNGAEVCEALKKEDGLKDIPVIMVTDYVKEKERSLSAGALDFISKSMEKIDLLLRIKSVLKVRHVENELQKMIAYIAELEKER